MYALVARVEWPDNFSLMDVIREKWGKGNAREGRDTVGQTSTRRSVKWDNKGGRQASSDVLRCCHFIEM